MFRETVLSKRERAILRQAEKAGVEANCNDDWDTLDQHWKEPELEKLKARKLDALVLSLKKERGR